MWPSQCGRHASDVFRAVVMFQYNFKEKKKKSIKLAATSPEGGGCYFMGRGRDAISWLSLAFFLYPVLLSKKGGALTECLASGTNC